ncbi:MAG TPA: EthD family reductase [Anaerolineales bacterium]
MHKLVILIEPLEDWSLVEEGWPEYLHQAEAMPGLRREATSRMESFLYGSHPCALAHELFFDSLEAARQAMTSPQGRAAGRLLQSMTGGRVTLFFADHLEDDLSHIQQYRTVDSEPGL